MNKRSSRGGADVVSDALPFEAFDDLAGSIWALGGLVIPQEISSPYAPSTVFANTRRFGNLALELSFGFELNKTTEVAVPVQYTATISEVEPYMPLNESELWDWRNFTVDLKDKKLWFSRGVSIITPNGEIRMEAPDPEEDSEDEAGQEHAPWQSAGQLDSTATTDDYFWFVNTLTILTDELRSGEF